MSRPARSTGPARSIRSTVLALGAMLSLAACENATTAPLASPTGSSRRSVLVNERTTTAVFTANDCSGEQLIGEAKLHLLLAQTTDSAGGSHTVFKLQLANLRITSPSGNVYVGSTEVSRTGTIQAGETQTFEEIDKLIGRGSVPNEVLHLQFHLTVNANGEPTAEVDRATIQCH